MRVGNGNLFRLDEKEALILKAARDLLVELHDEAKSSEYTSALILGEIQQACASVDWLYGMSGHEFKKR